MHLDEHVEGIDAEYGGGGGGGKHGETVQCRVPIPVIGTRRAWSELREVRGWRRQHTDVRCVVGVPLGRLFPLAVQSGRLVRHFERFTP